MRRSKGVVSSNEPTIQRAFLPYSLEEKGEVSIGMEIVNLQTTGLERIGKEKKKQQHEEEEDQQQPQEQEGPHLVATAASQDHTKSNSLLLLPVAYCSEQGLDEKVMAVADVIFAPAAGDRMKRPIKAAAAQRPGGRIPRHVWGDCLPHVVLLREALLSSCPAIAVLGPLHGCFAFYVAHLHNEVLSSSYAKTMFFGANVTRLESAFMWVGGWRPTSALVLVYSLMGIDLEDALQAARVGVDIGRSSTASILSTRQLAVMHSLQKHTQHAEMKISKKLTVLQMLLGDQDVLEAVLKDAASPVANDSSRFHQVAEERVCRLQRLVVQAEDLRLHTLKDLLSLLTPIQAARCGVAVFELCSSLRTMGSTLPPNLPAVTMLAPLPLPNPSGLVEKSSVDRSDEPEAPDPPSSENILNSSDLPLSPIQNPITSDLSTSDNSNSNSTTVPFSLLPMPIISKLSTFDSSILKSSDTSLSLVQKPIISNLSICDTSSLNSSEVPFQKPRVLDLSTSERILNPSEVIVPGSESYKPLASDVSSSSKVLHGSDVRLHQPDETALLVSSCSNSSSSQLLAQNSSQSSQRDHKSRSWLDIPLEGLNLDDVTDGGISTSTFTSTDEHHQRGDGKSEGMIVSNRLLVLSPASSDVTIQNCSLDSFELPSYFETPPQLPCASDDIGISYQGQPGSRESRDIGRSCQTPPDPIRGRMSVPSEFAQQGSQSKEEEAEKHNRARENE